MPVPVRAMLAALLLVLANVACADEIASPCANPLVSVRADGPALSARICNAADRAADFLASCNLELTAPVEIAVVEDLGADCVARYLCEEGRIEILPPDAAAAAQAGMTLFADLPAELYYDSVLLHELVHAAFDTRPCAYGNCVTTTEYLAYGLQISTLGGDSGALAGLDGARAEPVTDAQINAMILLMDPQEFAVRAWAHLTRQPDICAHVGRVAAGAVSYDIALP